MPRRPRRFPRSRQLTSQLYRNQFPPFQASTHRRIGGSASRTCARRKPSTIFNLAPRWDHLVAHNLPRARHLHLKLLARRSPRLLFHPSIDAMASAVRATGAGASGRGWGGGRCIPHIWAGFAPSGRYDRTTTYGIIRPTCQKSHSRPNPNVRVSHSTHILKLPWDAQP